LYAKDDQKEIQQKALPVCIYPIILSSSATELHCGIGELAVAVHFLAMQSCEYSKVSRAEQRQMKQLCLCPVKIWALIIRRILSYKRANKNSPVSLLKHKSKIINITGEMIADLCRDGVITIRETKLGIRRSEIGTRSIRSGAAMAMYLAGVPVFLIMLIGRWSSTAFLKYIRKQVQEFSQGISSKVIEVQTFKHVQNPTETNPMENIVGNLFLLLMG
jgi:hypothetical protein